MRSILLHLCTIHVASHTLSFLLGDVLLRIPENVLTSQIPDHWLILQYHQGTPHQPWISNWNLPLCLGEESKVKEEVSWNGFLLQFPKTQKPILVSGGQLPNTCDGQGEGGMVYNVYSTKHIKTILRLLFSFLKKLNEVFLRSKFNRNLKYNSRLWATVD